MYLYIHLQNFSVHSSLFSIHDQCSCVVNPLKVLILESCRSSVSIIYHFSIFWKCVSHGWPLQVLSSSTWITCDKIRITPWIHKWQQADQLRNLVTKKFQVLINSNILGHERELPVVPSVGQSPYQIVSYSFNPSRYCISFSEVSMTSSWYWLSSALSSCHCMPFGIIHSLRKINAKS